MKVCAGCKRVVTDGMVICKCGNTSFTPIILCTTCYGKQCYKVGNGNLIKTKCSDCGLGEEE